MTGEHINSLVGDLVAMARAMEEKPVLEQTIHNQAKELDRYIEANKALNDSNDILRTHIDELNARIAEVTKERDDASFRVLEAEDKAAQALDLCRTLQTGLGQVIAKLEPVKVEEPKVEAPFVASADTIIQPSAPTPSLEAGVETAFGILPSDPIYPPPQGQSEADPTTALTSNLSVTQTSEEVAHGSVASSVEHGSIDKPYLGLRYRDVPGYVSKADWLAGGGTEEDYYLHVG